ncbi:MAG: hypothetical protein ABH837_01825 [bacterium]
MKVGKVTHYYGKIGVAIIEVSAKLKVGDHIQIKKDDEVVVDQTIESMQIEKEQIKEAKKGDVIGLKVDTPVREDLEVYKES